MPTEKDGPTGASPQRKPGPTERAVNALRRDLYICTFAILAAILVLKLG